MFGIGIVIVMWIVVTFGYAILFEKNDGFIHKIYTASVAYIIAIIAMILMYNLIRLLHYLW